MTDPPAVTPAFGGLLVLTHGAGTSTKATGVDLRGAEVTHLPTAAGPKVVPSKLNCPVTVPPTALTLTTVRTTAKPPYACGAHVTVVVDVHAVLPHPSDAVSETVAVAPVVPKFSPPIVTVPPSLGTAFAEAVLTTGAAWSTIRMAHGARSQRAAARCAPSKLNCPVNVPTTALTLTAVRTAEPP